MQFSILVLTLGLMECAAVVVLALQRHALPGRTALIGMQLAIAWWLFCAAMEIASDRSAHKILWSELAWPGICATVCFWFLFVRSYIRGERGGSKSDLAAVAVAALAAASVTLTNGWHGLFYTSVEPLGGGAALRYMHGPLYFALAGLIYGAMLLTAAIIISAMRSAPKAHRGHLAAMLGCAFLPWLADFSYTVLGFHLFEFDPTLFSFAVLSAFVVWLISRRQLFDVAPLARDALVDIIPDAVVVIDASGLIVDVNSAAGQLLGSRDDILGHPAASFPVLTFLEDHDRAGPHLSEIELPDARRYEIRSSQVRAGNLSRGRMFLFRDVTERRRLERQLVEQASRDPLTGLYNRRFAEALEGRLFAEAEQNDWPISAVMVDLDHFKSLNDRHGHAVGDEVLRLFARMLMTNLGPTDYAIRYGGEEFLILLPRADAAAALRSAEHWQNIWRWEVAENRHLPRSSFSAGVASYPRDAASMDQLVKKADALLYRAKQQGRDRILGSAGPEPSELRATA